MKPCLRCHQPKPPGQGRKFCDACTRYVKPGGGTGRQRPCRACGGFESKQPGNQYCDECRALRRWAERTRSRHRKLQARHPCARCGRPKPAGQARQLCDQCRYLNATYPCQGEGCSVRFPRFTGDIRRYCDACAERNLATRRERQRYYMRRQREQLGRDEVRRRGRERWAKQSRAQKDRRAELARIRYHLRKGETKRIQAGVRNGYKENLGHANTVVIEPVRDWVLTSFGDFKQLRRALPVLPEGLSRRLRVIETREQANVSAAAIDQIGVLLGDPDLINRLYPLEAA